MILILVPFIHRRRPRTDQGKLSFEHIEKLGEFIQAEVPDKITDALFHRTIRQNLTADDPGVCIQLEHQAILNAVLLHELCFPGFGIRIHTAEFIHLEELAVFTHTGLGKENRAGRLNVDQWAKNQRQNCCNDTTHKAANNIQQPLGQQISCGHIGHTDSLDQLSTHVLDLSDLPALTAGRVQLDVHSNAHLRQGIHQLIGDRNMLRQGYIYFIHPFVPQVIQNGVHGRCNRNIRDSFADTVSVCKTHALDLILALCIGIQRFNSCCSQIFRHDQIQRCLLSKISLFPKEALPENPDCIGNNHIEYCHQANNRTGGGISLLRKIQVSRGHQFRHDHMLESVDKLKIVASF